MNIRRANAICRKMQLDDATQCRLLADMERRANDADNARCKWLKRKLLLWALRELIPIWCSYRMRSGR